jgi:hypothetical protein
MHFRVNNVAPVCCCSLEYSLSAMDVYGYTVVHHMSLLLFYHTLLKRIFLRYFTRDIRALFAHLYRLRMAINIYFYPFWCTQQKIMAFSSKTIKLYENVRISID